MPIPDHVERDVNPLSGCDPRVNLVFEPVIGDLLLNHPDVPGIFAAKVAATAGDSKSAFGAACGEGAVRPADRTALAECNLVLLWLRRRLRFGLGFRDLFFLGLDLCVL